MVNTGKPSKGCYMCRALRIKCDEGKPGCMRCQKSKRICPGYRDAFELNLRDETKSTKKKMSRMINHRSFVDNVGQFDTHTDFVDESPSMGLEIAVPSNSFGMISPPWSASKTHSSKGSISSTLSGFSTFSTNTDYSTSTIAPARLPLHYHPHSGSISPQLCTPIDQQASCFFLANFVLLPQRGTMRGYLDFLLPLLSQHNPDPCISAAFSAVALAALGTRPNSKSLLGKADLCYVAALTKINSTLRDPQSASTDSALASVLLLGFFEQITAPRLNHQGWNSHVDGAVALLKARGPEQFRTPNGRGLWHTVRALMTIQHLANSRPIKHGVDWWMSVPPIGEGTAVFAILNLKVADLRAENDTATTQVERTAANTEKVLKVLRAAEQLEQEYVEWFQSLSAAWEVKPVTWIAEGVDVKTSPVHPGRVDTYSEMWIAYHYNIARSSRIFIWTTILRCVAWLGGTSDYTLTEEYAKASQVCRLLIEDIVASIPYFFSWNKEKNEIMADKSSFACGTNDSASVKCLWGIFIMWPLFAAASSDFALPSQRVFLRSRLRHISEMMGIYQASVLLKAPLVHPSIYIARERKHMQPHTCTTRSTQIEFTEGVPKATVNLSNEVTISDFQKEDIPIARDNRKKQQSTTPPREFAQDFSENFSFNSLPHNDPIPMLQREECIMPRADFRHGLVEFAAV